MKRILSYILFGILIFGTLAIYSGAASDIVDSMEFQDEGITLTLEEAKEIILENNPTIEKSKLDLEQAQVTYEDLRKDVRKAKDLLDGKRKDSGQYLQAVTIPELTAGFTRSNAERSLQATIEGQKAEIESAYFGLLQAQELKEINKANMNTSKELYEKAQKKLELGLVAKQEVLNSELNYIDTENRYRQSEDNIKMAKMALNTKLGYEVMRNIELQDELSYKEFEVPNIAEAVSSALNNRTEIKAAEFQHELQRLQFDIISKQYPEITFMYREQKVEVDKALSDLETARKNIEMEVRSNYLDVLKKQEEIKAGEKSVELAEEALRLSQLSYDVGMSVLTDVQQAQTMLQQSKLGLSKAILDYNLAVLKFEDSISVGRNSIYVPIQAAQAPQQF